LCMGDDVVDMLPAAVIGALTYIVAFGSLYLWVIRKAPEYYADAGFRLRTNFLLQRWHPEFWFWGIIFLLRNLLCSLVPSITTDGSQQVLIMFCFMLPMFVAQVRSWPWRDEMANKHDMIMVSSLLVTLVIALCLEVHGQNDTYRQFLEVFSTLCFTGALITCLGILLVFLWKNFRLQEVKKFDATLPKLMGRPSVGKDDVPSSSSQDLEAVTKSSTSTAMRRVGTESREDDRVGVIFGTLLQVKALEHDESALHDIIKQLGSDLPSADLKKLEWSMRLIAYNVLGDLSKRPSGIALTPATTRRSQASSGGQVSGTLSGSVSNSRPMQISV